MFNRNAVLPFSKFKKLFSQIIPKASVHNYALIVLDIKNFSLINTCFGMETGNELLKVLDKYFTKHKTKNDIISRVYADNYVILTHTIDYFALEDKVVNLTKDIHYLGGLLPGVGEDYILEFTSGVCYIEDTKQSVYDVIEKANRARTKMIGAHNTNRLAEWTQKMETLDKWTKDITVAMNSALENGEFLVYYQPKYSFKETKLIGAEALVRWNYPGRGIICPNDFIPVFEDNGFIFKIDTMMFERVCKFLNDWNKLVESLNMKPFPITISFNLSRNNLTNTDIPKILTSTLDKYKIEPSKVEVEVTESFMTHNQQQMLKHITELSNIGFPISIDDFGAGYSSLNVLKDVPADIIKLDKEFLNGKLDNRKNSTIIKSIIDMAKKLDIKTVAEGVETKDQAQILSNMGCDIVQGYLYAKPMPEQDFVELLKRQLVPLEKEA